MTQRQLRDGNHNKIHLRCNHGFVSTEVDAEMSIGRKEFEDFLAKYLVEECGFAEPVRTTEIYTDSEHQAQVKLLQGQTRVEYVDGEGKTGTLTRRVPPKPDNSELNIRLRRSSHDSANVRKKPIAIFIAKTTIPGWMRRNPLRTLDEMASTAS